MARNRLPLEKRRRANICIKFITDGVTINDIVRLANTPIDEKGLGWNVKIRQIYNYLKLAHEIIEKEFEKEEKQILLEHKLRRLELYRAAKKAGQHQAALSALESLAVFEGVSKRELDINLRGKITLEDIEDLIDNKGKSRVSTADR